MFQLQQKTNTKYKASQPSITKISNKEHSEIRRQYIQSIQKTQRFSQRLKLILTKFQENVYDPHIVLKELDDIVEKESLETILYLVNNSIDIISLIPQRLYQIAHLMKGKMAQVQAILLFGNLAATFDEFGQIARQVQLTQQAIESIKLYRNNADIQSLYFWALSQLLQNSNYKQISSIKLIGQQVQYCLTRWEQNNTLYRLISILSKIIIFPINFIEQLCEIFWKLTHQINKINCFSTVSNSIQKYIPDKILQIDNKEIKKFISFMIKAGQKIPSTVVKNFYSIMRDFVKAVDYEIYEYICKQHLQFVLNIQQIPEFYEILYVLCLNLSSETIMKTFFQCQDENGNNLISILITNLDDPNRRIIRLCLKILKNIIEQKQQLLVESILRQGLQQHLQTIYYSQRHTQLANQAEQLLQQIKILKSKDYYIN